MKKWLFMFSVLALTNGVCAMSDDQVGDDWDHVKDDPAQLVQDLIDIKKNDDDWETLEPADITRNSEHTVYDDYPVTKPSAPIPVPKSNEAAKTITLPASPAPSSTSYTSVLSSSSNSRSSSTSSAPHIVAKPTAVPYPTKINSTAQQYSPIAIHQTVAASMQHMTSSIISASSIETSADEDRGAYCHDHEMRSGDDDAEKDELKKEKKRPERKYQRERPVEELDLEEFVLGVVGFMLGLGKNSNQ